MSWELKPAPLPPTGAPIGVATVGNPAARNSGSLTGSPPPAGFLSAASTRRGEMRKERKSDTGSGGGSGAALSGQPAQVVQLPDHLPPPLLHRFPVRGHHHLGVEGRFVGVVDAGELLQLAEPRLAIEALRIAPLAHLHRAFHVDLDKPPHHLPDFLPDF